MNCWFHSGYMSPQSFFFFFFFFFFLFFFFLERGGGGHLNSLHGLEAGVWGGMWEDST